MDHPAEDVGEEDSAGSVTILPSMYGAEQAELRVGAEVRGLLSIRRLAEVDVLMPGRNAERNAVVDRWHRRGRYT